MAVEHVVSTPSEMIESSEEILRRDSRCRGVLLFGSGARGSSDRNSDLDLLVLYRHEVPEEVLDLLQPSVSVSFYDEERLRALPRCSPLFAIHLAREGLPLYDPQGAFRETLNSVGPLSREAAAELAAWTRHRLDGVLADPCYSPSDQISASELYALAKQTALLISAERSDFEFDRHRAFADLAGLNRELRGDLEMVSLLEPAWLSARPTYEMRWPGTEGSNELSLAAVRVIDQVRRVGS